MSSFTEEEIEEAQACLAKKIKLSEEEWDVLRRVASDEPDHARAFLPLYVRNNSLYRKIASNSQVEQYGHFVFFPETMEDLLRKTEPKITPRVIGSDNRGWISLWELPKGKRIIKPVQNQKENRVANIVSDLEIGPKQYSTIDYFLTEEFLEGVDFPNLPIERQGQEEMYGLGVRVAQMLKALHGKNVYYNDTTLTDDMGKSHLVILIGGKAKLLDFGAAIDLSDHPNLTDEEVYLYARTLPSINAKIHMATRAGKQREVFEELVEEFCPKIRSLAKDEILARDLQFIREGLWAAGMRMPSEGLRAFHQGFQETYVR